MKGIIGLTEDDVVSQDFCRIQEFQLSMLKLESV
jgi:hypothetical protein